MMVIQYEKSGADQETMEAIDAIRAICNEKCFLAGFSVVIKDTKDLVDRELPIYVGLAVALSLAAMSLTMESMVLPFVFLASIGMAILYNFGTNIFLGEISYITQAIAAVLQLGVTMDYSIFLYHRYKEDPDSPLSDLVSPCGLRTIPYRSLLQIRRGPAPGYGLHRGQQQAKRRV